MKRFDGKVVVITGGGSGMGKISCTLFAQEGASVCVVDINEKTANASRSNSIKSTNWPAVLYALKDFLIKRLGSLLEHTT